MDNNLLLMIVLAFVVGYMCSGMIDQMCRNRIIEGSLMGDVGDWATTSEGHVENWGKTSEGHVENWGETSEGHVGHFISESAGDKWKYAKKHPLTVGAPVAVGAVAVGALGAGAAGATMGADLVTSGAAEGVAEGAADTFVDPFTQLVTKVNRTQL